MLAIKEKDEVVRYFDRLSGKQIENPNGVYTIFLDGRVKTFKAYMSRGERAHVSIVSSDDEDVKLEAKYHRLAFLLRAAANLSNTEAMAILKGRETDYTILNKGRVEVIKRVFSKRKFFRV